MIPIRRALLVAAGGALGTAGRLGIDLLIPDVSGLPVATFTANIVGAFLIGVLAARMPSSSDLRVFLATGILGGFTTYSAFAVGTVQLWEQAPWIAAGYVGLTLIAGLAAAAVGLRIGKSRRSA